MVGNLDSAHWLTHSSLGKMTRRNSQQKKEPGVILSDIDLINMDINKMSYLEFRIMIINLLAGLEKNIDTREFLSAEIKSNQAKV